MACLGFASFDVWWFVRLWYTRLAARFRKPLDVTGEAVIKSICWTTDIDYFLHMNNAKYLKELDFARFDYYFRTGLWELFKTYPGSYLVQHASTIRYRKSIDFLVPFKVVTKLVYFDDHALYFEQRFISYPDGFVRAVAICKNTAVKVNIRRCMEHFGVSEAMECPPDVKKFIECHELSSEKLKATSSSSTSLDKAKSS